MLVNARFKMYPVWLLILPWFTGSFEALGHNLHLQDFHAVCLAEKKSIIIHDENRTTSKVSGVLHI